MKNRLDKLNYKGQKRISVINAEEHFIESISTELRDVIIDRKIDPRYPYQFIIIFVKTISEIEMLTPMALIILWMMVCCGSVIRKKHQKSIALILIAIMDGKCLMIQVFTVYVWLL